MVMSIVIFNKEQIMKVIVIKGSVIYNKAMYLPGDEIVLPGIEAERLIRLEVAKEAPPSLDSSSDSSPGSQPDPADDLPLADGSPENQPQTQPSVKKLKGKKTVDGHE
jgi:hypothetical protein